MMYTCPRSKTRLHDFNLIENVPHETVHNGAYTVTSPAYQMERCIRCGYRYITYTDDERTIRSMEYARMHAKDFLQPGDSRYSAEYGREHALSVDDIDYGDDM
jgi:hypothetical protein